MACTPVCASNDPQSCDALCGDGIPFVWTVAAGTIVACAPTFALARAQANYQALNLACQRARQGKICFITQALPNGKVGVDYNQTVRAMGGVPWQFPFLPLGCNASGVTTIPYEFEIYIFGAGPLPDGLTLGCLQGGGPGQIMGKPTTSGTYLFTIQVTDAVGAYQRKQFSITIDGGMDLGTITPPITSGSGASWGTVPAGNYRISYVNGALRYGANALWFLNIDNGLAHEGYKIVHSGGTQVEFPGTFDAYGSQALVEAANVGKSILIHHTGGEIKMYLTDSNYGDNGAGMPNPTFRLST
jgi:hypothetical protein